MTFALQVWTGPTMVKQIADALRAAGLHVSCEGTDRVYFNCEASEPSAACHNALASLLQTHGTDFGLRPRKV